MVWSSTIFASLMEPEIELEQHRIIDEFHKLYYESEVWSKNRTTFLGIPIGKCPLDLWIYQELIYKVKPKVIIETGTFCGGSASYLMKCQEMSGIDNGMVITMDTRQLVTLNTPKITQIIASSTNHLCKETCDSIIEQLGGPVMVILDSDHRKFHVLKELDMYASLVTSGSYLIIEDGNINGNPVLDGWGDGPKEAIEEWYPMHYKDFENDKTCEKFMMTFNPGGYFIRS